MVPARLAVVQPAWGWGQVQLLLEAWLRCSSNANVVLFCFFTGPPCYGDHGYRYQLIDSEIHSLDQCSFFGGLIPIYGVIS